MISTMINRRIKYATDSYIYKQISLPNFLANKLQKTQFGKGGKEVRSAVRRLMSRTLDIDQSDGLSIEAQARFYNTLGLSYGVVLCFFCKNGVIFINLSGLWVFL